MKKFENESEKHLYGTKFSNFPRQITKIHNKKHKSTAYSSNNPKERNFIL